MRLLTHNANLSDRSTLPFMGETSRIAEDGGIVSQGETGREILHAMYNVNPLENVSTLGEPDALCHVSMAGKVIHQP
jgi:hypothetical protein